MLWVSIRGARQEAADVLGRAIEEARASGWGGAVGEFEAVRKAATEGRAAGGLLVDGAGRAVGIALWESIEGLGRRAQPVYLDRNHRDLAGWKDLLDAFLGSSDPAGPVLLVNSPLLGLDETRARSLLGPWGFVPYHRVQLVLPPNAPRGPAGPDRSTVGRIRPVTRDDMDQLVRLHVASYRNELERFLYATSTDAVADARRLLLSLLEGRFGTPVDGASLALEIDGTVRGVSLVTRRPEYLLIADVEVDPQFRGRGHAGRLIRATLEALSNERETPIALAVVRENAVAYRLYLDLGFVPHGEPEIVWANPTALGIPAPTA